MAKKKTVGKLGAGVLAATTVISGLGFGIMPAGAATETKASSTHEYEVGEEGAHFQLISKTATGYSYFAGEKSYGLMKTSKTLEEAEKDALEFTAHFAETIKGRHYWQLRTTNAPWKEACLIASANTAGSAGAADLWECNAGQGDKWTVEDGSLKSKVNPSKPGWLWLTSNSVPLSASYGSVLAMSSTVAEHSFVGLPTNLAGLSADVQDVDLEAGTALLDGVAPDEATDVEVSYLDKDSKKKTYNAAAKDGKWSQALSALALGNTSVHLKAYNGAELIAESDVDVDLPVTPLSVQPELSDANVEAVAKLTGSASKNTTIKVKSGTKQVATTMTGEDGSFEVPVNAPNAAGDYELTATQEIRDEDATPQDVTIPYGAGVAVSSPENGAELDAGQPLVVSGTAQRNSLIRVYEKGNPRVVLGQATATNGYRIVLNDLEDREYQLVVAGVSKGNNVTTAEVTVNPGKNSLDPATVTTTEFTAGTSNTFEGTATADATLHFVDAEGNDILGRDITATGGQWSFTKSFPADAREFSFRIVQTKGAETATSDLFTLNSDIAGFDPVEMTTKTVIPGLENRFTGTATRDASLRVLNASGTQIVNGTINTDPEDGTFSFNRVVSANATKLDFKIEQTKDGKKVTSPIFSLAAEAAAAPAPVTVENKSVEAGVENTFTGTGPADAKFRVLNLSNTQIVPGEFDIENDGKWQFSRVVSRTATKFDFKLEVTLPSGQVYRTKAFSLQASTFRPVTVDQTSVTPGVSNRFSGTATPDATYRVLNVSGTQIVPGTLTIGSDGKWQFDRVVSSTATNFRFKLEVTKNGQTETSRLFELRAN